MKKALILEDDPLLIKTLERTLGKLGIKATSCQKLEDAWKLVDQEIFDLALLDRILPDGDGLELIKPLLDHHLQTRILLLTQQAQTHQKVSAFKCGADDYLAKPFDLRELELRLKSLMAKNKIVQPDLLYYKNLLLYPETGQALINHDEVQFRPKQAKLLACLIQHQGMIATPRMIFSYVWGDQLDQPNYKSLAVYIRRLRMKLGKKGPQIETVREVGYRLV